MSMFERAHQIWALLVCAASDRRTFTYGEVSNLLSGDPRAIGGWLGPILLYCEAKGLPPLTVLVTNKRGHIGAGGPASARQSGDDLIADQQTVFGFDWFSIVPPDTGDFQKAHRAWRENKGRP